jgi:hypothetical protein
MLTRQSQVLSVWPVRLKLKQPRAGQRGRQTGTGLLRQRRSRALAPRGVHTWLALGRGTG